MINWELVLATVTAGIGIWQYLATRNRELAWKRTEFLFAQAQLLDNDPALVEVGTILEGRHARVRVYDLFHRTRAISSRSRNEYLQKLDTFLNLYERLAYAVLVSKTLSREEIHYLGWFLLKIGQNEDLVSYCWHNGYDSLIRLAHEMYKTPPELPSDMQAG